MKKCYLFIYVCLLYTVASINCFAQQPVKNDNENTKVVKTYLNFVDEFKNYVDNNQDIDAVFMFGSRTTTEPQVKSQKYPNLTLGYGNRTQSDLNIQFSVNNTETFNEYCNCNIYNKFFKNYLCKTELTPKGKCAVIIYNNSTENYNILVVDRSKTKYVVNNNHKFNKVKDQFILKHNNKNIPLDNEKINIQQNILDNIEGCYVTGLVIQESLEIKNIDAKKYEFLKGKFNDLFACSAKLDSVLRNNNASYAKLMDNILNKKDLKNTFEILIKDYTKKLDEILNVNNLSRPKAMKLALKLLNI